MTKAEFLKALEEKLSALSAEDRAASLAYYEEIIDDRMEEGLCEADAVAAAAPSIYAQQGKCRNHAAFSTLKTIKHPL